ncbi:uncharacterized protein DDB_G0283697 [Stomoxys calcitrans]|uniref:uncharacterized protein DDB_G0283697 n=1 Tax=Stomoxys calcitrans TaxID=35570 RepID=UPI0027E24781|nr:uncharacterized protein DDB_G0283697 [Stomoxys calcitrans]
MTTTIVNNRQFCFYTLGLLIVWLIVLATASSSDNLLQPQPNLEEEQRNTRNCKGLCDQCACLGFYCGEECICECNNDNGDTECIARMQENAAALKMPFELLIQGPSRNTFVRNAFQFEQNNGKGHFSSNIYPKKRFTVTVYRPEGKHRPKVISNSKVNVIESDSIKAKLKDRPKRSSESRSRRQFEWFSELSQNLVKPAPLGGRKKKTPTTEAPWTEKPRTTKSSLGLDKSWFTEAVGTIFTPAPLAKRRGSTIYKKGLNESSEDEDSDEESRERETGDDDVVKERYATSTPLPFLPKARKEILKTFGRDLSQAFGFNADKSHEEEEEDEDEEHVESDTDDDDDVPKMKNKFVKKQKNSPIQNNIREGSARLKAFGRDLSNAFDFILDKSIEKATDKDEDHHDDDADDADTNEDDDNERYERKPKFLTKNVSKKQNRASTSEKSKYLDDDSDDDELGTKLEQSLVESSKKKRRKAKNSSKAFLAPPKRTSKRYNVEDKSEESEENTFPTTWWRPGRLLKKVQYVLNP